LAQRISQAVGGVEVQVLGMPISGSAPSRYVPSIDRARKELNLDIRVFLEEAIQKTLRFVRENPHSN
jgi:dTDP-glucose 4,6-dehydratase